MLYSFNEINFYGNEILFSYNEKQLQSIKIRFITSLI